MHIFSYCLEETVQNSWLLSAVIPFIRQESQSRMYVKTSGNHSIYIEVKQMWFE